MPRFLLTWALVFASCAATPALAVTPFTKAFEERYLAGEPSPAFRTAVKKTRCNVCHVKGEPKTVNNAYGDELAKFLEGNAEERLKQARAEQRLKEEEAALVKELQAAFAAVEKIKAPPGDATAPTYRERIQKGELPIASEADEEP